MKLKEIRRSKIDLLHLVIALPIALLISYGIFFVFLIIAWERFGEGDNSKLYSHWTSLSIYTITLLVMQLILYQLAKIQTKKENIKRVKSYYCISVVIIVIYLLVLYFLYF